MHGDDQDAAGDEQARHRQQQAAQPAGFAAVAEPVAAQAEQGQAEGQEHVDAVQDHQQLDPAAAGQQDGGSGGSHQQHAVLGHQAAGQVAELVRHPGVGRHVGQHGRAAQEAGIRSHQQQAGFEGQGGRQGDGGGRAVQAHLRQDGTEGDRVQGLAGAGRGVPQQIQQDDPARGKGQAAGHVEHRGAAGAHARLGQRIHVVRDRFDAGIGAAAQRVGFQQQRQREEPRGVARQAGGFEHGVRQQGRNQGRPGGDAVDDQQSMGGDEAEEDRQQDADRLLHAAQVQPQEQQHQRQFGAQLPVLRAERQHREQRVGATGDRDRHGQHVIDDQRRARDQAGVLSQQDGGDAVAAAPGREQLDHLVVGEGDDEDRDRGGQRQVEAEVGVRAEGLESFFRTVGRGRQAVGAEADPGQEGGQGERMACFSLERVEGPAEEGGAQGR
jgi:hypothetical protein